MTKATVRRLSVVVISLILAVLLFGSRYKFLTGQPFLNGPDAYYYALQIKFFIADGVLKIPDSSPLLQLMGFTGKIGLSPEQTIILWTVLIQLLCGISVFAAYRLMHGKEVSGIIPGLLVAWTLISPTLTFTCIEFPKYAFALIFLPLWPVVLANRRWWPVSAGAVLLSWFSHLTMIGIFMVLLVGLAVFFGIPALLAPEAGWKAIRFKWPVVVAGVVILLILAGFVGGKYLLLADLKRIQLQGLQPGLWTFLGRSELPVWLKAEVLSAVIVCMTVTISRVVINLILNGYEYHNSSKKRCAPLLIRVFHAVFRAFRDKNRVGAFLGLPFAALLLFVPLGSKEIMGIPERLCLALPLMAITSLAGQRFDLPKLFKGFMVSLVLAILAFMTVYPKEYLQRVHPGRLNPDYALYDQVATSIAGRDIPMLIAHQGLNYYYKFKTMKESFPYEPESHWPKLKVWRLVYGITPSTWAYYLPEQDLWGGQGGQGGRLFSLPEPYSLIREDLWVQFRDQIRTSRDEELQALVFHSWLNPSQKRPEFARKRAEKDKEGDFSAYPVK
jgi:hypothetical protein